MLPITLFVRTANEWVLEEERKNVFIDILDFSGNACWVFIAAVICAMAVFHYMYTQRNANMIHALPVNRTQLYVTNYLSGLLFLVVPQCFVFLVTTFVCSIRGITDLKYLLYWLLMQFGMGVFAYSMAVVTGMLTGQLLMLPVFFFIFNFLYMGCQAVIGNLTMELTYGLQYSYRLGRAGSVLSPLYYLANTGFHISVEEAGNIVVVRGIKAIAVYALIGIVLAVCGWIIYKKRRLETVGDFLTIRWLKPAFRWGTTLFLAGISAAGIAATVHGAMRMKGTGLIFVSMILIGIIIFFLAQMLLEKNFRVVSKKRIVECLCVQCLLALLFIGIQADVLGLEKKIPAESEIEKACLNMNFYTAETKATGIKEIQEIHREILKSKKEFQNAYYNSSQRACRLVGIKYYCKDGTTLERHYYVPLEQKYLEDENYVVNRILDRENEYENYMAYYFGNNYESAQPMSVQIELYNIKTKSIESVGVSAEFVERFFEAFQEDIKEGSLKHVMNFGGENDLLYTMNMDYYNSQGIEENDRSWLERTPEPEKSYNSSNAILNFSKDCKNIMKVLEETGLLDGFYRLPVEADYQKIS